MWIAKGINVTRIYSGDSSYNNDSANIQTLSGVGWNLPIQKIIIDPGVTVEKLRIPYNSTHGYVEVENNGTIDGTSVLSDHPVENATQYTTIVSGNGLIKSRKEQRFTFVSGSSALVRCVGGQGGASSPDFYHIPKYGRKFGGHLERKSGGSGTPVTVTASNLISSTNDIDTGASNTILPIINSNGRIFTQQLFTGYNGNGSANATFTVDRQGTYNFYVAYIVNGPNGFSSDTGTFKIYKNGVLQKTISLFTTSGVWKSQSESIYLFAGESLRIDSVFPAQPNLNSAAAYVYVGADTINTTTLTPIVQTNNYDLSWTYNECDYKDLGGGNTNLNATGIFSDYIDGDGNISTSGGNASYLIALGGHRRDTRDVTVGTAVLDDGNRYWWICSNAKRNWGMYIDFSKAASQGYCLYVQPGWRSRTMDKTNASISSAVTSNSDQNPFAGPVDYTKYTGIIQGV